MKPKEYVTKFSLTSPDTIYPRDEVLSAFRDEFEELLMVGRARENIKGYENAIRALHMKKEAIIERSHRNFKESIIKTWKFFYATLVAPLREDLFPEDMEKRREEQKRRAEYKSWEQNESAWWNREFMHDMYRSLFKVVFADSIIRDFATLGLSPDANVDQIKAAYRTLVVQHHPDKGGNRSKFETITEAKNRCLQWLGVA